MSVFKSKINESLPFSSIRYLSPKLKNEKNRNVKKKKSSQSRCWTGACLLPVQTLDKGALETLSFESND